MSLPGQPLDTRHDRHPGFPTVCIAGWDFLPACRTPRLRGLTGRIRERSPTLPNVLCSTGQWLDGAVP